MTLAQKRKKLEDGLRALERVVVAFSGGVDSSVLLRIAVNVLGSTNVLALIAASPTYPEREKAAAIEFCKRLGITYVVVKTDEMDDDEFVRNDPERCYYCKLHLYTDALRLAKKAGFRHVVEGSNVDDLSDHRPGRRALAEKGIKSPLLDAGLGKEDIRTLARRLGVPSADKPAKACLASRIPYGTRLDPEVLHIIDEAEAWLEALGFSQVRVRFHGDTARIELLPAEMAEALQQREAIVARMTELGFTYVSLDLAGYRTGSMNEAIGKKARAGAAA